MSRIALRGSRHFESPSVRSDLKSHDSNHKAKNHSNRCEGFTAFLFKVPKGPFRTRNTTEPPGVMDVRTFGSMDVRTEVLVFSRISRAWPKFLPPDVRRDIRMDVHRISGPKTYLFGLIFRSWLVLPALLQKLVGEFFWFFAGKFGKFNGKFGGNFPGIFSDPQNKGSKFSGKFRSIFRKKIRGSKKIFRAKFTLQTCHLNDLGRFQIARFNSLAIRTASGSWFESRSPRHLWSGVSLPVRVTLPS